MDIRGYAGAGRACAVFLVGLLACMVGCAGPEKTAALDRAKAVFAEARNNPQVAANAPVALHEAEQTLKKAEQAENEKEQRYLSYLAQRRAEVAVQVAQRKEAEKEIAAMSQERRQVVIEAREREAERARLAAEEKAREAQKAATEARRAQAENEQLREELSQLKARQTERGIKLTLGDILFKTGRADLMPGAMKNIDQLASALRNHPNRNVLVEGFTDNTGGSEYNLKLSRARADAVANALIASGVDAGRVTTRGYGENYPVANNNTATGRQLNRRVEVTVLNQGADGESVPPRG